MIVRGNYIYECNTFDGFIQITEKNTGKIGFITSNEINDLWKKIKNGADPIQDGWEDGIGNVLSSIMQ